MKDFFIVLFFVAFACCIISFLLSVVEVIRKNRKLKLKNPNEDKKESVLGLLSGEIFFGAIFLALAVILTKSSTDEGIMLETAISLLALSFVWGVLIRVSPYRRRRILSFALIVPIAIFISGVITLFSVYYYGSPDGGAPDEFTGNVRQSLFAAFLHAARLFTLDGGYTDIVGRAAGFGDNAVRYTLFIGVLYVVAAFTTFTTLLTVVKNLSAKVKYWLHACLPILNNWREVHVFSSLSDESLALAASLTTAPKGMRGVDRIRFYIKRPIIVFASTVDGGETASKDLIEEAKERGAILFSKDISSIRFRKHNHFYYVMGTNEGEKLRAAKELITYYGPYGNKLYVFSETAQSEMFLNALDPKNMKLVRVNAIQSLIYRALYDSGERLFKGALPADDGSGDRVISAVIVGLGMYGKEMLKALTWFCQMDGYRLKINAYDSDENAEKKLRHACPELMRMSDNDVKGEAHYSINVHTFDIDSNDFFQHLSKITDATYVFVCLGEDERNLQISKSIREMFEGLKRSQETFKNRPFGTPEIETVIYDSSIKEMLSMDWSKKCFGWCDRAVDGGRNFKNQPYRIHVIGDLKSFYSVHTLTGDGEYNGLVKAGEEVHLRWTWANFVNSRHRDAVLAHVKDRSREGMPEVVWLVKPHLDCTPPDLKAIPIENIKNGSLKDIGIDECHYDEIISGLRSVVSKAGGEELTDDDYNEIISLRGRFHFIYDVLTKNYELSTVDEDEYNEIKTPEETLVLTPEGEESKTVEKNLDGKALRAFVREERAKARAEAMEYFNECEKGRKSFWRYTYYYRSSLAKAMHEDLRRKLASDPDKSLVKSEVLRSAFLRATTDRNEEELNAICALEHLRWNAFTRAEGYCCAKEKYDLAKHHNNLVSTEKLTPSDLRKDA